MHDFTARVTTNNCPGEARHRKDATVAYYTTGSTGLLSLKVSAQILDRSSLRASLFMGLRIVPAFSVASVWLVETHARIPIVGI
jgi:FtsH-binding integral membrane protein